MTPADRAYVLAKSRQVTEATLTNMRSARALPYALGPRTTERAGTFVIVGAGPSLERTGPELARMQREGAVVCCVNAALPAVVRYCVPDVVLAREVVDVSGHLAHPAGLRVLDLAALPKVWDVARAQGPCAWFVPGAVQSFELALAYGVRPLFGGTAAATALVALCEEWGAEEIALVAMDFSPGAAKGSAWDGYTVDDAGNVSGAGQEAKRAAHAASGILPPPERVDVVMRDGWYGGPVRSLASFGEQIEWLENFAARHPEIRCMDYTGAGVLKKGWHTLSITMASGWSDRRVPTLSPLPAAAHDAAREHVLAQSRVAEAVAVNVLDPEGCPLAVPRFVQGWDVVDAMVGADMLRALEAPGGREAKIRAIYGEAMPEAARRVRAAAGSDHFAAAAAWGAVAVSAGAGTSKL